jgi:RNA polymerase sigma-70 factor (sigma-E family)
VSGCDDEPSLACNLQAAIWRLINVEDLHTLPTPGLTTVSRESAARATFDEYVAARSPALLRLAYLLVGDRGLAEDLLQETFIRVYPRWSRILRQDPEAYVRRSLARNAVSLWRRGRHFGHEVSCAHVPDTTSSDGDDADPFGIVWQAVRGLPPRQRAVVVLTFYADMSEAEIATALGCAVGTVKSQKSRALARVRADLAGVDVTGTVATWT